ncbi:metal ion binding protein [Salix suchowensis]|nr:metal ion binding protein [Salix suchowensis]
MGNENNDTIVIQSSIALLQERFRQLQRVKAMREEKELSKNILVESTKKLSPTMQYYEPAAANSLFFHPEFFLPPSSPPHIYSGLMSLSSTKTPSKLGVLDKLDASATDDGDIDTSLHL